MRILCPNAGTFDATGLTDAWDDPAERPLPVLWSASLAAGTQVVGFTLLRRCSSPGNSQVGKIRHARAVDRLARSLMALDRLVGGNESIDQHIGFCRIGISQVG